MSKITVGCRLPNGLVIRVGDPNSGETRVELRGQNADMNGAIFIQPTHCGYTEVDKDFWDKWVAANADFPAYKNGAIFAESSESKARGSAKERVKEVTGLEGVNRDDRNVKEMKV